MWKNLFFSNNKLGGDNITFTYRYRKQIIVISAIAIIIIMVIILLVFSLSKKEEKKSVVVEKNQPKIEKKEETEETYKVDIKGEINSPGLYSIKKNSRVMDVIQLAGGITDQADTSVINLSKKIQDEMVIIIYSKVQVKNFEETKEVEKQIQEKCKQPEENSIKNDACIQTDTKISGKISINTATKEELMTLPGIGESKAKDIISYREKNGPFATIEDLAKVSGIGESTIANIKENITV